MVFSFRICFFWTHTAVSFRLPFSLGATLLVAYLVRFIMRDCRLLEIGGFMK